MASVTNVSWDLFRHMGFSFWKPQIVSLPLSLSLSYKGVTWVTFRVLQGHRQEGLRGQVRISYNSKKFTGTAPSFRHFLEDRGQSSDGTERIPGAAELSGWGASRLAPVYTMLSGRRNGLNTCCKRALLDLTVNLGHPAILLKCLAGA